MRGHSAPGPLGDAGRCSLRALQSPVAVQSRSRGRRSQKGGGENRRNEPIEVCRTCDCAGGLVRKGHPKKSTLLTEFQRPSHAFLLFFVNVVAAPRYRLPNAD